MVDALPDFCLVSGHRIYRLARGEWVVGRSAIDGLLILDRQASRQHSVLRVGLGAVEVEDLGSRNGTWVNGKRISTGVPLRPGDRLQIGETILVLEVDQRESSEEDEDWTDHANREVVLVGAHEEHGFVETETTLSVPGPKERFDTNSIAIQTLVLAVGDPEWADRIREGADILPAVKVVELSPSDHEDPVQRVHRGLLVLDIDAMAPWGESVLDLWRSEATRGPVILSTPHDDEAGRDLARGLGAQGHVRRGSAAARVVAEVRHLLRSYSSYP